MIRHHFNRALDGLEGGSFKPVWPAVNEIVELSIQDNFFRSASPDGQPWPRRGDPTQSYRIGKDETISYQHGTADAIGIFQEGPLLIMTSRLLQSATREDSPEAVVEMNDRDYTRGTDVEYAATHNYGSSKMPQREFMGAQEDDLRQVDDVIADFGLTFFAES